ncbi:MAG: type toxin-antitoxin system RelE/ParE family toxin [Bacteroidetes bacterium]|nr:type toxin-antitoxin system RelE/ParE family toxin [Bacteroidota bacterium]
MEGQGKKVLVVGELVQNDLEQEYIYYADNYSIEAAERLRIGFNSEILKILPNPYIFPECRFLPTKTQIYRNIVWGNYLIIYKIKRDSVEVLSLFHSKQKPSRIKMAKRRK